MTGLLAFFTPPAFAVVGYASYGAQWQKHVVMVLSRSGARAPDFELASCLREQSSSRLHIAS
jgi:hypothetical protein